VRRVAGNPPANVKGVLMSRWRIAAAAAAGLTAALAGSAGSAPSSFTGLNGRILFDAEYGYGLVMVNQDGSGRTVVPHTYYASSPATTPTSTSSMGTAADVSS
jgi:hypothetical protein